MCPRCSSALQHSYNSASYTDKVNSVYDDIRFLKRQCKDVGFMPRLNPWVVFFETFVIIRRDLTFDLVYLKVQLWNHYYLNNSFKPLTA